MSVRQTLRESDSLSLAADQKSDRKRDGTCRS